MTAPAWPYCLGCAWPARSDVGPALQTGYRIILCAWEDARGKPRGCGKTLGTLDQAEAVELVERRRRQRLAREHPDHRTASGIHRDCPACAVRGEHLDHLERKRLVSGCAECDQARRRAEPARVGR